MERRQITPGFIDDALICLRAKGHDPTGLLDRAGIVWPSDAAISAQTYGRFWRLCAAAMQDEFFGLAARPMRPGGFALMCHATLHAPRLDVALRRALQFLNVVLDHPQGRLHLQDGLAHIVLEDRGCANPAFAYRTYWLMLLGLGCWLIGRRIPLRRVDFACPAPAHRQDYLQFFGAPVTFDQPLTRLAFDTRYLAAPLVRSPRDLAQFLRAAPGNILVRYRQDGGIGNRIRRRLQQASPAQWPDATALAAELGTSPATLRRRLSAEGQSLNTIRDEVRRVASQRLLRDTSMSLAAIAVDMGFSEASSFVRAFRLWTGVNPGAFRKSGLGDAAQICGKTR
jgi:AraC-like DNA-binding protein